MTPLRLDSALNALRLIAIASEDKIIKQVCFNSLKETEAEIKKELSKTCWHDVVDNIRTELEKQYVNNMDNVETAKKNQPAIIGKMK